MGVLQRPARCDISHRINRNQEVERVVCLAPRFANECEENCGKNQESEAILHGNLQGAFAVLLYGQGTVTTEYRESLLFFSLAGARRSRKVLEKSQVSQLRTVMREKFLTWLTGDAAESPEGQRAIDDHAFARFVECQSHIVPWVGRHIDLRSSLVVDLGCGTGSSTAAFALASREVHGYDIDDRAIPAAQSRMEILGIQNCSLHLRAPNRIADRGF